MIAWSGEANILADSLKENTMYVFTSVKVNKCNELYSMASPGIQLVYTTKSSFQECDNEKSFSKPPIALVNIADLIADGCTRQTFAGLVAAIGMPIISGNSIQRTDITVNDGTAKIDVSFWGKSITTFGGNLNDVILIENCIVKQLGAYTVVNSSSATITLNPVHPDLQGLYSMGSTTSPVMNRSPQKVNPVTISSLEALAETNVQQQVEGTVIGVTFSLYDQCPFVSCRKTVKKLDMDIYSCSKCNRLYKVSSTGLRLSLTVHNNNTTKSFVLFNDKAEQLVGMKTATMLSEEVTAEDLAQRLNGITFIFILSGGRKADEFLCHSFSRVCGGKDTYALSSDKTSSSSKVCGGKDTYALSSKKTTSSVHNEHRNIDHQLPVPAFHCQQTRLSPAHMLPVTPPASYASAVVGGHRRSETVCFSEQSKLEQSSYSPDTSFSDVFENLGNLLSRYPPSPNAPPEYDVRNGRKRKRSFNIDDILGQD